MTAARQIFCAGRNVEHYPDERHTHPGLAAFLAAPDLPSGIHSIATHETFIDVLWTDRGLPTTVVVFHAALKRSSGLTLPAFYGKQITGTGCNFLAVADPCLYRASPVNLAWYAGAANFPLQHILPSVLRKFLIRSRNIVFFGASGGGFAALHYSHKFPGSLAIAVNPQTRISLYNEQSVATFLRLCHNDRDVLHAGNPVLNESVVDQYSYGYDNFVLYCQNTEDDHIDIHMKPFIAAVRGTTGSGRTALHLHRWGEGHTAPPKSELKHLVQLAVASGGDWPRYLDRFTQIAND
jgi:hypothetical protein